MEEDHPHHQERKKRKLDESENNEEEKVEEFFALIRSTREVRDRLRSNNCGSGLINDQKLEKLNPDGGNRITTPKEIGVWKPTFRPEDFLGHDHEEKKMSSTLPLTDSVLLGSTSQLLAGVGASKMEDKEGEKNEKEDNKGGKDYSHNNLDLELSL